MTRMSNRAGSALSFPAWLSLSLLALSTLGLIRAHAAPVLEPQAMAPTTGRFCYRWSMANATTQDANDLHVALHGMTQVGSWYVGALNPFGAPGAGSGYDAATETYRANFGGALVLPGEWVQLGLCTDHPALEFSSAVWTVDGAPITPAPLTAHVRFARLTPTRVRVEVTNAQTGPMDVLAFNVLDAGAGLALDDLDADIAAQLPMLGNSLDVPEALAAGGVKSVELDVPADSALVLEAVLAPEADAGNAVHVLAQMLPPGRQFLPVVTRR